jgi:hypothetical protein
MVSWTTQLLLAVLVFLTWFPVFVGVEADLRLTTSAELLTVWIVVVAAVLLSRRCC